MTYDPNRFNNFEASELDQEFGDVLRGLGKVGIDRIIREADTREHLRSFSMPGVEPLLEQMTRLDDDDDNGSGLHPRLWPDGPLSHGPTNNVGGRSAGELAPA